MPVHNPNVGLQLCSQFSEFVQPGPEQTRSVLSYNAPQFTDFLPAHLFLNLAKQLRGWTAEDGLAGYELTAASRAPDGYYFEIPSGKFKVQNIWALADAPDAFLTRYALYYTGVGTVRAGLGMTEVSNTVVGNGGVMVFDIVSKSNVTIEIISLPDPTNYLRDFIIVPQASDWKSRIDAGEVWNPEYLDTLRPNGTPLTEYRHLNSMQINNSTLVDFSDRPLMGDINYTANGIPIEHLCTLALETGHAPWFCIPAQASDQFVLDMAALVASILPAALLAETKVEYTNEPWNELFHQNSQMVFEAARDFGGVNRGTTILIENDATVTLSDASGLANGDFLAFYNDETRRYDHRIITAVSGNDVTVSYGFGRASAGPNIQVVSSDFNGAADAYARRAIQVMALWETGAGVRPIRVMGGFLANPNWASNVLSATRWQANDPGFMHPATIFDEIAITTYFSSYANTEAFDNLLPAFDISYETGRDLALERLLNTPGAGLDQMRGQLVPYRTLAHQNNLRLTCYEGFSDHTIANHQRNADDERLVPLYEQMVHSADFTPVWQQHFEIQKRFLDGPAMIYVDIAPASKFSLFGLRRSLPDTTSQRASIIEGIANGATRYWGDDVPPQTADLWEDTIARTTNETGTIDYRQRFTANADTFSATGLPAGVTMASNGVLTFAPTTEVDVIAVAQITVTTSEGEAATVNQTFDITYVEPIAIPAADYATLFSDASGITLLDGAIVSGGELICEVDGQNPHADMAAFKALVEAADPDQLAYTFTYRLPDGYSVFSGFELLSNFLRPNGFNLRVATDGVQSIHDIRTGNPLIADGNYHRLFVHLDFTDSSGELWLDGALVQSFTRHDGVGEAAIDQIPNNKTLRRATSGTLVLGDSNSVLDVRFSDFQAWFDTELTPEQIVALGT